MLKNIKVAVCGELPTACDCLLRNGVVQIDKYDDATEIRRETDYHLILIYAPNAEGLLNTQYSKSDLFEASDTPIPIRLLGEPCCKSALVELKSTIRRIDKHLKTSTTGPVDVVLILDTSTSMEDTSGGVTRLQRVIEEANKLIEDLLTIKNVRIAIVTYNYDSETVIPLDFYTNGLKLVVNNYFNNNKADAGVVYAYDNENKILGKDSGYTTGTNLQAGIDRGFNILANADNVEGRVPVAVVLTDGQSNRAERDDWYTLEGTGSDYISDERMVLSTMLNAAYNKAKVEEKYGREQRVYSISVDLPANSEAHALMNPGALVNGFNSGNSHDSISEAYEKYLQWAEGDTVTITAGGGWYGGGEQWRFDHNYPTLGGAITDQDIINNINYVSPNSFYDVTSTESSGGSGVADLSNAFEQIYQELSSGVFNPITDSSTVDGSIGVDNTPLIYVDYIGRYMEIKEITHVTVFGASYGAVNNGDGTYTVAAATGTNATITETDPGANFSITYRTRNHSGENADADNAVVIPADGNATAVIINDYTPLSTAVDMDVRITKNFTMEGSHGGTYAAAYISWTLNVPKDEYVTVSFDVRVDEPDAIVANTAVVRDGVNTYTTNEVVNHTIENELKKDVFTPADLTVSIDGKKVYAGDELVYEITFTNASADAADIEITDIIPANTTYVDGSASEGGVYDNGKLFWDIDNISAWSTVKVSFKVTVNANVGAATIENRATATDGTNEYETDVVTNYTVEDEVGKEVFSESDPSINIDGRKVLVGDVLVYAISYTNTSKESANVTIVDTVPQYTSYVIGSADNAGVFENGKITWNLEVAPDQTVTVTFKVRVEDGGGNASIANKAQVLEGRNVYTTNEVINPSDTPVIPNPPTSDGNNLWKWITLLFISGTGLTGIKKYKKNRADAENA